MKIVSLNLWHRSDPWPERLAAIRSELTRLDADLVGLQEALQAVDVTQGDDDQVAEISGGLGYESAYAPACVWDGVTYFGNALLSRHPIIETRWESLPGHREESRSMLYALVETPSGRLPVFVTHLAWRPEDFATRQRQVLFLRRRIDELAPRESGVLSPVLMGDLNAEPHSDEIRSLADDYLDAWVTAGDGSDGFTWDRRNPYTHAHDVHSQRIDYIFVRAPVQGMRIVRCALAFNSPTGEAWPSDHFGLCADFEPIPSDPS